MVIRLPSVVGILAAVLSTSVTSACGKTPVDAGVSAHDFAGTVVSTGQTQNSVTVLIWDSSPPSGYEERLIHILPDTRLVREQGGALVTATPDEIVIGAIVRVKTTGVERRSIPPQYDAIWMEIIPPQSA